MTLSRTSMQRSQTFQLGHSRQHPSPAIGAPPYRNLHLMPPAVQCRRSHLGHSRRSSSRATAAPPSRNLHLMPHAVHCRSPRLERRLRYPSPAIYHQRWQSNSGKRGHDARAEKLGVFHHNVKAAWDVQIDGGKGVVWQCELLGMMRRR